MKNESSILIGNTFPLSLVRRPVRIRPAKLGELQQAAAGKRAASFWGHENTRAQAEAVAGLPLAPHVERPAIQLQESGLPSLNGQTFCECWILSPDYAENFRPATGGEVSPEQIRTWQVLKITWEPLNE